ncbi:MAG: gamma-glutamylcyclotransferase [Myxococcales bacterium]|nr:gamma-glutamylcyclotransferase [Myxococcales bacterium]
MSSQEAAREDLWLFGYGSLIWRPDFVHAERAVARVDGWVRRFWQGSVDHRGVPGAPGRVVTLLPDARGHCVGMAFRVGAEDVPRVIEQLDLREVGGYERVELAMEVRGGVRHARSAVTYVATADNDNFLGDAPVRQIAEQVLGARGPSGHNAEYVLRLDEWLRDEGLEDPHVHELAALVRAGARRG